MNTPAKTLLLAATLAFLMPSPAKAGGDHGKPAPAMDTATTDAADMADGEVRKVDMEGGKLTLKHGDIKSLDMPGMTMVFVAKDKAMLDKLKVGDKVKFKAINDGGKFSVVELRVMQ